MRSGDAGGGERQAQCRVPRPAGRSTPRRRSRARARTVCGTTARAEVTEPGVYRRSAAACPRWTRPCSPNPASAVWYAADRPPVRCPSTSSAARPRSALDAPLAARLWSDAERVLDVA
ncbi:hypothetical protein LUX33_17640 [Actinomadura madurae]|nr:hypothetical protein [Actinomadura madurae]MCP9950053.1 hypothetical protein [Actinomadura madurae]MCP9966814.1 hypothetical protein [Actinomadura madurae]MCP9979299.1 hypothetical protein [Actinomadura madurae]